MQTATGWNRLGPGDRIPAFKTPSRANPRFTFDSVAGRWLVLGCLGSLSAPQVSAALRILTAETRLFDDQHASLFLMSSDPQDATAGPVPDRVPGLRVLLDPDLTVSTLLGATDAPAHPDSYRPFWIVMDPGLTIRAIFPLTTTGDEAAQILDLLARVPPPARYLGFPVPPPVLILPDVFEPAFCDHLIALYHRQGAEASGFMRDIDGQTVAVQDPGFKVRRDYVIDDPDLIKATQTRIIRKVIPQIERVHFFRCTRMERYMVGGYPADEGGHFRPHRDNTTLGTAHRRFAVSINLNDDFDGGAVSFPEYSPEGIKAPKGAAVIFSCALLHAVGRVTRGTRYAFLPFLYDEAAAKLREANAAQVPNAADYKA
jgi:predicted 2-oxoglutarate/Fe(II)-dependent dioxygenase YbiX/peroxiredoxin